MISQGKFLFSVSGLYNADCRPARSPLFIEMRNKAEKIKSKESKVIPVTGRGGL
jgi:hypothetical protein